MGNSDVALIESKKLHFEDRAKIVDALLACSCIFNRDRRETVLGQLNEEFTGIVNKIRRSSENNDDVTEIVSTCLKHPGSLQELVKIVAYLEGKTASHVQKLRELIHNLLVSQDENVSNELEEKVLRSKERALLLEELMAVITELKVPEYLIKDSYDKCVPDDPLYIEKWNYPGEIIEALRKLNDMPMGKNDIPKLIHFVKILAPHYPIGSQKLWEWLGKNATEWQVDPSKLHLSIDEKPHQKEEQAALSLLFKLESRQQRRTQVKKKFYVKNVWLHRETGDVKPLSFEDAPRLLENIYTDDTVHKILNFVVNYTINYIRHSSNLSNNMVEPRFEFFLPFDIFTLCASR